MALKCGEIDIGHSIFPLHQFTYTNIKCDI